jgi:hypothetical protein
MLQYLTGSGRLGLDHDRASNMPTRDTANDDGSELAEDKVKGSEGNGNVGQ